MFKVLGRFPRPINCRLSYFSPADKTKNNRTNPFFHRSSHPTVNPTNPIRVIPNRSTRSPFTTQRTMSTLHQHQSRQIPILQPSSAYQLDQKLFSTGHSLSSLVQLAGASCVEVLCTTLSNPYSTTIRPPEYYTQIDQTQILETASHLPLLKTTADQNKNTHSDRLRVLVCIGPGNNGADGLVVARLLQQHGFDVMISAPRLIPQFESNNNIILDSTSPKTQMELILPPSDDDDDAKLMERLLYDACNAGCKIVPSKDHLEFTSRLDRVFSSSSSSSIQHTSSFQPNTNINSDLFIPHIIVDSIFGFSFTAKSLADIRPPFDSLIKLFGTVSSLPLPLPSSGTSPNHTATAAPPQILTWLQSLTTTPKFPSSTGKIPDSYQFDHHNVIKPLLYCIDAPSGWNVADGDVLGTKIVPDLLISLTAPKPFSLFLPKTTTTHAIAGTFVPRDIADEFGIGHILDFYGSQKTSNMDLSEDASQQSNTLPKSESIPEPDVKNGYEHGFFLVQENDEFGLPPSTSSQP